MSPNVALTGIRANALRSLIPPRRLALSEWIETSLVLPEGSSAFPGLLRLYPYQREIADAISDPAVERVTLVKAVRIGFTTLLTAAIGNFVVNDPSPILALLPTESDARDYMVSEIEPIFAASKALRGVLSADCEDGERNTLLSRRFAGGSLKIAAAKAPRNLRRHTARILLIDEADAMEIGAEGNPIRLAERRTLSFGNRKIIIGSTPIFEDTSHVLRAYAESDQSIYEVPCPECGAFTEILWEHIEWEPGKPETAAFRCPHCQALVAEKRKAEMVSRGRWRPLRPEAAGHAGFRLNALVSLLANASWGKLAAEFIAAKEDPSELQVFANTVLAQGWREAGAEIDEAALVARAEPFGLDRIPEQVLCISAGVDGQDDRLEVTLAGWTRAGVCFVLGHVVLWGSLDDDTTWFELRRATEKPLETSLWRISSRGRVRDRQRRRRVDAENLRLRLPASRAAHHGGQGCWRGPPGDPSLTKQNQGRRALVDRRRRYAQNDYLRSPLTRKINSVLR